VGKGFDGQFHFTTDDPDQIALLFFVGQEGLHEFGANYVAVSYVKGHVLLTWDLGSGPRRIFTKRPVDSRYFVHTVRFGRFDKQGWLQVDRLANVTGRVPGLRASLNVTSKYVYLGGHPTHNFTFLPHDLPVHKGFAGCLFDFSMRSAIAGTVIPPAVLAQSGAKGRNVGQCGVNVCESGPCHNGGTCIDYGSSYM